MKLKKVLGIDIGGSGVKGAIVHTKEGKLKTKRYRIPTPQPATPEAVADVIKKIVDHFKWEGHVGVGFPGVIQQGFARTAANLDDSWIDVNLNELFSKKTGCEVHVVNDADAAGMAEMKFGSGKGFKGVALLVTVGTGLGTVIFTNGRLLPNMEMGHILLHGADAEEYASDAARKADDLSWEDWAGRFNEYLHRMEELLWPDMIIIGGGASKKDDKFIQHLDTKAKVVPATLLNEAGIIGAALTSKYYHKLEKKSGEK
ncbi:MAG: ROK family protein [Bacteroidales bacterium]|nr:ROK family protein [Bacteroidales bacterium]MDT8431017.1 ROK family protein [Bacteroidales bacterium]